MAYRSSSGDWDRRPPRRDGDRKNPRNDYDRRYPSNGWDRSYSSDNYGKRARYSEPDPYPSASVSTEKVVYVGNLPYGVTEFEVMEYMNMLMHSAGLATGPGNPVLSHKMSSNKNFGLLEFRSTQEATKALGLDGVRFNGQSLRLKFLNESPKSSSSGTFAGSLGSPSRQRVFVQNIPLTVSEMEVRELLKMLLVVAGKPEAQIFACHLVNDVAVLQVAGDRVTDFLELDGANFKGNKLKVSRTIDGCLPSGPSRAEMQPFRGAELGQGLGNMMDSRQGLGSWGNKRESLGSLVDRHENRSNMFDRRENLGSMVDRRESLGSMVDRRESLGSMVDRRDSLGSMVDSLMPTGPSRTEMLPPRAAELGLGLSRMIESQLGLNSVMDSRSDFMMPQVPSLFDTAPLIPPLFPLPTFQHIPSLKHVEHSIDFSKAAANRVLHVRNLPRGTKLDDLKLFLNVQMHKRGLSDKPGNVVVNCFSPVIWKYALVEFRSEAECTNALDLDKIEYEKQILRVRRPSNYQPPPKPAERNHFLEVSNIPEGIPGKELMDFIRNHMKNPTCIKSYRYRKEWKAYLVKLAPNISVKHALKLNGTKFHDAELKVRELKDWQETGRRPEDPPAEPKSGKTAEPVPNKWEMRKQKLKEKKQRKREAAKKAVVGEDGVTSSEQILLPKNWKLCTWNVQGAVGAEKQAAIDTALFNKQRMLAVLQETHLPAGSLETETYSWYVSGEIAILLKKNLKNCVQEWKPISSTLATMKLKSNDFLFTIVAVQGIPDDLQTVLSGLPEDGGHFFVIGDFGVKMTKISEAGGSDKCLRHDQILFEAEDKNGETLKNILKDNNLFLTTHTDIYVLPVDGHVASICCSCIRSARSEYAYPRTDSPHMIMLAHIAMIPCPEHPIKD